jgi:hypothetical protein
MLNRTASNFHIINTNSSKKNTGQDGGVKVCRLSSQTFRCLKIKVLCCFEMSVTNYPVTWQHIPDRLLNRFAQGSHVCNTRHYLSSFRIALYMGRNTQNVKHKCTMYLHFFWGTADFFK